MIDCIDQIKNCDTSKDAIFGVISVVGLGYIGLPTAAMFATRGVRVIGVDVNSSAIEIINSGKAHIIEPDLDVAVRSAVECGNLKATLVAEPADAFIVAVPTPFKGTDHEPDLSYVEAASRAIAPVLKKGNLVILESTSPVGATEAMANWLAECRPDLSFPQFDGALSDIRIAHCPERVLPGKVMQELITNDRIIGGMTHRCSEAATNLYKLFVTGECVIASSPRVAEMAKLTENSFRDLNIAFANELSVVCDALEMNVWELIRLANRHPRVNILQPGPGVGGHCIAVDPWFIVHSAPKEAQLIRLAREVNDQKPNWVLNKIRTAIDEYRVADPEIDTHEMTIALYGLTFKPDIDDLRESPSLKIAIEVCAQLPMQIIVVEPNIRALPHCLAPATLTTFNKALASADIHVMLVDHTEFRGHVPKGGILIDTRGVWANNG